MSKSLTFSVEIDFESSITDDNNVIEVAQNIANAIKKYADNELFSPKYSDTFAEIIRVTPQYVNKTIIEHLN